MRLLLSTFFALGLATSASAISLISEYTFDNGLDSLGNSKGRIVAGPDASAEITGGALEVSDDAGWTVEMNKVPSEWSIVMRATLDTVPDGYNSLLNLDQVFPDGSPVNNTGLYLIDGSLWFFPIGGIDFRYSVTSGEPFEVVLTFDGIVTRSYLDGVLATEEAFPTLPGYPGNLFFFTAFRDDGNQDSPGSLDYIQVYDGALSQSEIDALEAPMDTVIAPIPLPAGIWLLGAGIGLLGAARKFRAA